MKRALLLLLLAPVLVFPQTLPQQDFLLLHNGDLLLVDFTHSSGGQLQFYALSSRARVDISYSRLQIDTLTFAHSDGWIAYPGSLDGTQVQVVLRETGGDPLPEIPGDSDVVVRVLNGRVKVQLHADNELRGQKCDRCEAQLDW
ncbi:MAG TPA: hypothetical protein VLT85_03055 [Terriglobales bacterium]|nr:hypothetical protein [Terriglobales bacterium]